MLAASSIVNPRLLPASSSFLLSSYSSSSSSSSLNINLFPLPPRSYSCFSQSAISRLRVKCTAVKPPKSPGVADSCNKGYHNESDRNNEDAKDNFFKEVGSLLKQEEDEHG
ncbi:hypothetical protein HPP92_028245 [Vanilla planifolia]|uniref:Uncharacterized protein n=1 Tax=Vanilla planifolia TaxID=51239 RepID=A0A835P615_VANPL|nr:hypothetical protein HPP92_028245 [Vanilla planifolia]